MQLRTREWNSLYRGRSDDVVMWGRDGVFLREWGRICLYKTDSFDLFQITLKSAVYFMER